MFINSSRTKVVFQMIQDIHVVFQGI